MDINKNFASACLGIVQRRSVARRSPEPIACGHKSIRLKVYNLQDGVECTVRRVNVSSN